MFIFNSYFHLHCFGLCFLSYIHHIHHQFSLFPSSLLSNLSFPHPIFFFSCISLVLGLSISQVSIYGLYQFQNYMGGEVTHEIGMDYKRELPFREISSLWQAVFMFFRSGEANMSYRLTTDKIKNCNYCVNESVLPRDGFLFLQTQL